MKRLILFAGLLLIATVTLNARQSDFPKLPGPYQSLARPEHGQQTRGEAVGPLVKSCF